MGFDGDAEQHRAVNFDFDELHRAAAEHVTAPGLPQFDRGETGMRFHHGVHEDLGGENPLAQWRRVNAQSGKYFLRD